MTSYEIHALIEKQRAYFKSGATLPVKFRILQLKKLYATIESYQNEISAALKSDLGKSEYEGFMCEVGLVLSEISYMAKHIKKFSKKTRVKTPIAQFHSASYIQPIPYGNVLIMSPWNYPFLLSIDPLVNAIAAGNTAIIKPSAYSPATSQIVNEIISNCFQPEYVATVMGGREENKALLDERFDFVFFTGSQSVGKEVLRHTAEHLTPAILELGGKSPCIVDESANITLAAKRIVFGKFLNCGSPDYILCHSAVRDKFIEAVIAEIKKQYGEKPLENESYGKIISKKHYDRILSLIDRQKVVFGGECDGDAQRISPTVMDNVNEGDAVMGEEIFGPIMPILTFDSFDDVVNNLKNKDKPLALYLFTSNKKQIKRVNLELSYGGGCINDVIIHLATSEMGFGGVGESGMGSYHGKVGFFAFSHKKSVVDKKTWLDLPMRYQPYNRFYEKLLKIFLK